MVLGSSVYSLVSGAAFGVLYAFGIWIMCKVSGAFHRRFSTRGEQRSHVGTPKHIFDFVIVILMGVSQLLSNYVLLDGVFRIYTALISVIAFFFFKSIFLGALEQLGKI